jgi:hypothetical protein
VSNPGILTFVLGAGAEFPGTVLWNLCGALVYHWGNDCGPWRYSVVSFNRKRRIGSDSFVSWPEPPVAIEPYPDDGPVLVLVEYQIKRSMRG